MRRRSILAASAVLSLALAGCGQPHPGKTVDADAPKTIQTVMDKQIDPLADALWELVGTVETKDGAQFHQPRSDAEWAAARKLAVSLIEGARHVGELRNVGGEGHGLADASVAGTRTAAQITADIAADPARFRAAAAKLQTAGEAVLAGIDARETEAIIAGGGLIDEACEACHAAYWYPRTPPGPLPDSQTFARIGLRHAGS